jgi:hypothetical protein
VFESDDVWSVIPMQIYGNLVLHGARADPAGWVQAVRLPLHLPGTELAHLLPISSIIFAKDMGNRNVAYNQLVRL